MTRNTFSCPNCKKRRYNKLFSVKIPASDLFGLFRCQHCQLVTTFPFLHNRKLYSKYYANYRSLTSGQRFPQPIDFLMKIWRYLRAWRIQKWAKKGPVLDVGCGQATELTILKKFGVRVYGLEYDKGYAQKISESTGIPIFYRSLININKQRTGFTLISFMHSLEHIPQSLKYLKKIHKLLASHGYLFISVPNFASLERRLFDDKWFHLDLPRHLYHFSKEWLVVFLEKQGFELVWQKNIAPEYDFFSLMQSTLNRIFPTQPNLLYLILLREERKNPQQYIVLIPQLPFILLLAILSLPITMFLWLIGGSGTIELVFQKRR